MEEWAELKAQGNAHFKKKEYTAAATLYAEAITLSDPAGVFSLGAPVACDEAPYPDAHEAAVLHNNRALALVKLADGADGAPQREQHLAEALSEAELGIYPIVTLEKQLPNMIGNLE